MSIRNEKVLSSKIFLLRTHPRQPEIKKTAEHLPYCFFCSCSASSFDGVFAGVAAGVWASASPFVAPPVLVLCVPVKNVLNWAHPASRIPCVIEE